MTREELELFAAVRDTSTCGERGARVALAAVAALALIAVALVIVFEDNLRKLYGLSSGCNLSEVIEAKRPGSTGFERDVAPREDVRF